MEKVKKSFKEWEKEADGLVRKALEDTTEFQYELGRANLLFQARDIYADYALREDLARKVELDGIVFRFMLTNNISDNTARKRFGRFAPMAIFKDKDGKEIFQPNPAWIDDKMLKHIEKRVKAEKNPLVLAVYYDLLFEHSKDKDKKTFIRGAIDNYLLASEIQKKNGWYFEYLDSLTRALEISIKTKDTKLQSKIIKLIINNIKSLVKINESRYSFELITNLMRVITNLSDNQVSFLIKTSRDAADAYGKLGMDNRHLQRSFLELIKNIYRSQKEDELATNITIEIAESYLNEAEEKSASGLVESHFLREGLKVLLDIGDPENRKEDILLKIEKSQLKSESEMKKVSATMKIKNEDIKKFVLGVLGEDKSLYLERFSGFDRLVPSYATAEEQVKGLIKVAPLSSMLGSSTFQDGRKVHSEPAGIEVTEEKVITQMGKNLPIESIFIGYLTKKMIEDGITADEFYKYLAKRDLFKYDNVAALKEGIEDYFEGKYYSALCVLLPELEHILRNAVRKLGGSTLKVKGGSELQQVVYIKDLLVALKPHIPNDLYIYLILITYDKRGLCLRDNVSHGLLKFSDQNKSQADLVLHVLCILASYQFVEKKVLDKS